MDRHVDAQDALIVVEEAVPYEVVYQMVFPRNGMVEDSVHHRLGLPPLWLIVVPVYHRNVHVDDLLVEHEAFSWILVYPLKTWRSIQVLRSGLLVENLHHC